MQCSYCTAYEEYRTAVKDKDTLIPLDKMLAYRQSRGLSFATRAAIDGMAAREIGTELFDRGKHLARIMAGSL